jgi:hypothetical protein
MEGSCAEAIGAVIRLPPSMNDQFRFCPPPEVTVQQVIPVVWKFIKENPQAEDLDIRDVANNVGRLTSPCR